MRTPIAVQNGETGGVECDECYKAFAADYLMEHKGKIPQRTTKN